MRRSLLLLPVLTLAALAASPVKAADKPDILVIWGDDVGYWNVSAYNQGMMGYETPNIDSLASEGALSTDWYAQQSCTAGRAAFILGQHPFRTGLLTIGMPGSPHGISDGMVTLATLLEPHPAGLAKAHQPARRPLRTSLARVRDVHALDGREHVALCARPGCRQGMAGDFRGIPATTRHDAER